MSRGTRTLLGLGALAALVLLGLLWIRARAPTTARAEEAPTIQSETPARPSEAIELSDAARTDPARAHAEVSRLAESATAKQANDPAPESALRGRALDLDGRPIAGVTIVDREGEDRTLATTAEDGTFPLDRWEHRLDIADPRWIIVRLTEPIEREGGDEQLVLAATRVALAGRAVGDDGAALRAEIDVEVDPTSFARFPGNLDRAREPRHFRCDAGEDGLFALDAPVVDRATLTALFPGYEAASMPAPGVARGDLVLTLKRIREENDVLVEGVVVHGDGSPAEPGTAMVHLGERAHPLQAGGRFSFRESRDIEETAALAAVKPGLQPGIVAGFGALVRAAEERVAPQRLVLGAPPLTIEGRVVDAEGKPKKGWLVQPVDPTELLEGHIPPRSVEAVVLEDPVSATSDGEGRFALRGLLERTYRLQAHSGEELVRIESEPIPAGARNVELVVPADARIAEVTGVVVGRDGTAIAGANVRAGLITFRTRNGYTSQHSDGVTTDAEGRFTLAGVPRRSSTIDVGGDAVLPRTFHVTDLDPDRPLRLEVARRCHFRVEGVPESAQIARIALRDARGDTTNIMRFQAGGSWTVSDFALEGGMTPVLAASEDARTLVFQGPDGAEVAARALRLAPGEITVVRW